MAKTVDEMLEMIMNQLEVLDGTDADVLAWRALVACYETLVDLEMGLEKNEGWGSSD